MCPDPLALILFVACYAAGIWTHVLWTWLTEEGENQE